MIKLNFIDDIYKELDVDVLVNNAGINLDNLSIRLLKKIGKNF